MNRPSTPSNLELMELVKDPAAEPDPLADWRMPYLDYLLREALPMDKQRLDPLLGVRTLLASQVMLHTEPLYGPEQIVPLVP